MDIFPKEKRSEIMRSIKWKNTDIERLLFSMAKGLWETHRYRKHPKNIPWKPDLYFPRAKLAVFVDGDFWHGKNYESTKNSLPDYWRGKIAKNMERDRRQESELNEQGIRVLRFWGSFLKKNSENVLSEVKEYLSK